VSDLLKLSGINTYYGQIHILENLSLNVSEGELVSLLGGNASGKSTTLKTILGLVQPATGSVVFDGEDVTARSTSYRIGRGMAIVPENRRLFAPMTVLENLQMGAYLTKNGQGQKEDFERVYTLFPLLHERRSQLAGTLSGGEQQMVAMGRALMSHPKLLLMDERSRADPRRAELPDHPAGQRVRGRNAGRGAEREHGAVDRRSRLRPLDRPPRPGRCRQGAPGARGPPQGLSRPIANRTCLAGLCEPAFRGDCPLG
jgi:ABC-type branched-subunit amino acid transport system ATPase component